MKYKKALIYLTFILFVACESKPKVIVEDSTATSSQNVPSSMPVITGSPASIENNSEMHQVMAQEILNTPKYTYLKVTEKKDTFWIASSKFEAKKGHTYYYQGGLLKTNFYSQEFNRTFDKIFLVSSILDSSSHPGVDAGGGLTAQSQVNKNEIKKVEGSIDLKTLIKNMKNYEGKKIIVTGKIVKVNNGIMGKNWIHLQDGSGTKEKPNDLTITTMENIPIGSNIALEGKIVLNKDFGAGYKYDILLEDATSMK